MKAFLVGFCCTCILFACFNFFFGETPSYREAVVVVKHGDTLWNIACAHTAENEDVREVMYRIQSSNDLKTLHVYPGQVLKVQQRVPYNAQYDGLMVANK